MRDPIVRGKAWFVPVLLPMMLIAGCGYTPPPGTDTASAKYLADFEACDTSVPHEVNQRNAKTGPAWFASPVTRWSQISRGMTACMQGKGWGTPG